MHQDTIVEAEAREFQDTILRSVEQHTAPYAVKMKGCDFVLFPDTFNPNYAVAALLLLDHLGVKKGDFVLDPFTGCGADAIFAVREGASRAVAIDKYSAPFLCARYNVQQLGLESKVDVRQGDLFDPLHSDEKFSLVIANPPFKGVKPETDIAAALRDDGYKTLRRFWREVSSFLIDDGRIRMVFSDVGDMDLLEQLAREVGFRSRIIAESRYASSVRIHVYEMKR